MCVSVRVFVCVWVFVVAITLMCYELSSDTSKSAEMQIDFRLKIVTGLQCFLNFEGQSLAQTTV